MQVGKAGLDISLGLRSICPRAHWGCVRAGHRDLSSSSSDSGSDDGDGDTNNNPTQPMRKPPPQPRAAAAASGADSGGGDGGASPTVPPRDAVSRTLRPAAATEPEALRSATLVPARSDPPPGTSLAGLEGAAAAAEAGTIGAHQSMIHSSRRG